MKTTKQNIYSNISQLKIRPLLKYDFVQFKETMLESKESISTFLDMGKIVPDLNTVEFMNFFSSLLADKEFEHFGVFHGWKMLAYASFSPAFQPSGVQVVYFVRQDFLRQNLGTFVIYNMTRMAWLDRDLDFVQAVIDKANIGSRKIVKSQGFQPLYALRALGQGTMATETQICYVHLNPRLEMKAAVHGMRPIDLIGHFCFIPGMDHLIHDGKVNEFFKWKYPVYEEDDLDIFQNS